MSVEVTREQPAVVFRPITIKITDPLSAKALMLILGHQSHNDYKGLVYAERERIEARNVKLSINEECRAQDLHNACAEIYKQLSDFYLLDKEECGK